MAGGHGGIIELPAPGIEDSALKALGGHGVPVAGFWIYRRAHNDASATFGIISVLLMNKPEIVTRPPPPLSTPRRSDGEGEMFQACN